MRSELCKALGRKAKELVDGMRKRVQRDPDVADYATAFESVLVSFEVKKTSVEPVRVLADIVRNSHAGYIHMRVKNGETGAEYDFILPEWAVTQSL